MGTPARGCPCYLPMEGEDRDEDVIPAGQGSPPKALPALLQRKATLRHVLLRAEHHRDFLEKCQQRETIPKGLRLNREVYFMRGAKNCQTASKIEDIISNAEKEMRGTLVKHYNDLTDILTSTLQDLENKLDKKIKQDPISNRQKKRVLSSLHHSEVEECKLRTSLEETRRGKLEMLARDPHHRGDNHHQDTQHDYRRDSRRDTRHHPYEKPHKTR